MRITYDKSVDAAYIYLSENVKVASTQPIEWIDGMINIDFSADGKMTGIEVIPASKFLDAKLLKLC